MSHSWLKPQLLLTPGPMMPNPEALKMFEGVKIHHRTKAARELRHSTSELIRQFLATKEAKPFFLLGSGTYAMDVVAENVLASLTESALVLNSGIFGERWKEICGRKIYHIDEITSPLGEDIDPRQVEDVLKRDGKYQAIFMQASDTSTGVLNRLPEITRIIRKYTDAFIVVDGVLETGVSHIPICDWDIDILVFACHKALMGIPGQGVVVVKDAEVLEKIANHQDAHQISTARNPRPMLSTDILEEYKKNEEEDDVRFTFSPQHMAALHYVLELILGKGQDKIFQEYASLADLARHEFESRGFKIFSRGRMTNALSLVDVASSGINAFQLVDALREHNVYVAHGQGKLKGEIIRIAHCGMITEKVLIDFFDVFDRVVEQ